jgi:hypothetical protein
MVRRARREEVTAALPSGHVGVYRAGDGKRWEAYVMGKNDLVLLGAYATIREAAAARAKYWKAKERGKQRKTQHFT